MGFLNRKALLQQGAIKTEKVDLGNGEFVYVREMSGKGRDTYDNSILKKVEAKEGDPNKIGYEIDLVDSKAKLAVNTLCDEQGNLLLQPSDIEELSKNIPCSMLDKIVKAAKKLNKIEQADKEEIVKNSSGDQVANSSSDSV